MESRQERLYQRLVALGMMPSDAERVIANAQERGERLPTPTPADAWRDAEEDAGPVGQERSRQGFMFMALLRPGMRPYARILEARPRTPTAPTKHYGPGDHPGGSPQGVHGRRHGMRGVQRDAGLAGLADFLKLEDEQEIESWLQENLLTRFKSGFSKRVWINWPDGKGKRASTVAMVRAVASELAKLEASYGERPDYLSFGDPEEDLIAEVSLHEFGRHRMEMRFNYSHDFALLQNELTRVAQQGYSVSKTLADVVAHEYGHLLMWRRGWERVVDSVYRSYNWQTLHRQLSQRSAEDGSEMFAEAFAARDRNPLAREIIDKVFAQGSRR